ncbi:hypothetical protein YPPY64_3485 [Yersinia pestis PY-64]|nr:hypothetical protein YPPY02_3363 [Yersinia pestis PY-02]EIS57856.1 hypothetical protein YPPY64_3485 [Yersinia pestis PY-64]EIT55214.1 hypothetical protein YPPY103_3562 [Yersinia pestis PY-103]
MKVKELIGNVSGITPATLSELLTKWSVQLAFTCPLMAAPNTNIKSFLVMANYSCPSLSFEISS